MKLNFWRSNKLSQDITWSLGSFAVLATSGILINIVVAIFRDAEALGVFNQSYAIYIVCSQLATFGIHYSVLRYTALYADHIHKRSRMLCMAALLSVTLGGFASLSVYFLSSQIGTWLDSEASGNTIFYTAFGLCFFPLNKVLLAYINGLRLMRAHSLIQGLRYSLIMVWVSFVSYSELDFSLSGLCFLVSELTTSIISLIYLKLRSQIGMLAWSHVWIKRHLSFGGKGLLAGMFVELNSRIDVLLIGFFLSDRMVGIYSFAAMLVDGLFHVFAMVRINFNPILVRCLQSKCWVEARQLLSKSKAFAYPVCLALSGMILLGFWLLTQIIVPERGLTEGFAPLLILLAGISLIAAFLPFDNLLMVGGWPGLQTVQHLLVVIINITLNLVLVPTLGLEGAALATATSYVAGVLTLIVLVRRKLHWNLLLNKVVA